MAYLLRLSSIAAVLSACGSGDAPLAYDPGPGALAVRSVLFTGAEFVDYRFKILRSPDGVRWTSESLPEVSPERVAANDGATLVGTTFVTETRTELYLSEDARTWERVAEIEARVGSMTRGNGIWLGLAGPLETSERNNNLVRSEDGRTWTTTPLDFGDPSRLSFAGGHFYLHGDGDRVLRSADGESWETLELPVGPERLVFAPIELDGEVSFQAARIEDGERHDALRLREVDGEWIAESIDAGIIVNAPVSSGGVVLANQVGDSRIFRLIDAESWAWEPIIQSVAPLGELAAGNGAVVAPGSPMAVSLDDGQSWAPGVEVEPGGR